MTSGLVAPLANARAREARAQTGGEAAGGEHAVVCVVHAREDFVGRRFGRNCLRAPQVTLSRQAAARIAQTAAHARIGAPARPPPVRGRARAAVATARARARSRARARGRARARVSVAARADNDELVALDPALDARDGEGYTAKQRLREEVESPFRKVRSLFALSLALHATIHLRRRARVLFPARRTRKIKQVRVTLFGFSALSALVALYFSLIAAGKAAAGGFADAPPLDEALGSVGVNVAAAAGCAALAARDLKQGDENLKARAPPARGRARPRSRRARPRRRLTRTRARALSLAARPPPLRQRIAKGGALAALRGAPRPAADAAAGVVALGAFRRDARVLVCAGGPECAAARWRARAPAARWRSRARGSSSRCRR